MYEKRVARGAKWLDKVRPDWYTKVNPSRLVLSDEGCVIGQVFGDFDKVMSRKFLVPQGMEGKKLFLHPGFYIGLAWMFSHGFDIGNDSFEDVWRHTWVREIQKRKAANREDRNREEQKIIYVPAAWERERTPVS